MDTENNTSFSTRQDDDRIYTTGTMSSFDKGSSVKRSNHEKHAELFRKDLISAMKLADSELLQPEEYFQISDSWKLDWERGVQVPINPSELLPVSIRVVPEIENSYNSSDSSPFILPKKLLHASQDDTYKPGNHELYEVQKLAEKTCRYDLDDLDVIWLTNFNQIQESTGDKIVTELEMEKLIEELEMRCYVKLQQALRTIEGLGIEYDENVVCDICRSPEGEDSNEMVFCDNCDICVHQACYGIQNIPEGSWLCRTCALGIQPKCALCPWIGGAMKSTKNGNEWAHISCALWVPEVSIGCPEKMEPITNVSQIPASRWALICTLCRERTGACIQCCVKSCKISFHVTCAFKHNLHLKTIFDEQNEDVQLKAFCPKHSGFKEGEGDDDSLSMSRLRNDSSVTEEERTEMRSDRLRRLAEEFYDHVTLKEAAATVDMDKETADCIYRYWLLKRKSLFNRPLLTPKTEEGDALMKQREDSLIARMKMFIHLRQDLERVRNLCYMVNKREKTRRQLYRMKEEIFHYQATVADTLQSTDNDFNLITSAHRLTNTIYDDPFKILIAAKHMEIAAEVQDQESNIPVCKEKMFTKQEWSSVRTMKNRFDAKDSLHTSSHTKVDIKENRFLHTSSCAEEEIRENKVLHGTSSCAEEEIKENKVLHGTSSCAEEEIRENKVLHGTSSCAEEEIRENKELHGTSSCAEEGIRENKVLHGTSSCAKDKIRENKVLHGTSFCTEEEIRENKVLHGTSSCAEKEIKAVETFSKYSHAEVEMKENRVASPEIGENKMRNLFVTIENMTNDKNDNFTDENYSKNSLDVQGQFEERSNVLLNRNSYGNELKKNSETENSETSMQLECEKTVSILPSSCNSEVYENVSMEQSHESNKAEVCQKTFTKSFLKQVVPEIKKKTRNFSQRKINKKIDQPPKDDSVWRFKMDQNNVGDLGAWSVQNPCIPHSEQNFMEVSNFSSMEDFETNNLTSQQKSHSYLKLQSSNFVIKNKLLRKFPLRQFIVSNEIKNRVQQYFNSNSLSFNGFCQKPPHAINPANLYKCAEENTGRICSAQIYKRSQDEKRLNQEDFTRYNKDYQSSLNKARKCELVSVKSESLSENDHHTCSPCGNPASSRLLTLLERNEFEDYTSTKLSEDSSSQETLSSQVNGRVMELMLLDRDDWSSDADV